MRRNSQQLLNLDHQPFHMCSERTEVETVSRQLFPEIADRSTHARCTQGSINRRIVLNNGSCLSLLDEDQARSCEDLFKYSRPLLKCVTYLPTFDLIGCTHTDTQTTHTQTTHTHTLSHTHTITHTDTYTHSLTHVCTHARSLARTHAHTHSDTTPCFCCAAKAEMPLNPTPTHTYPHAHYTLPPQCRLTD